MTTAMSGFSEVPLQTRSHPEALRLGGPTGGPHNMVMSPTVPTPALQGRAASEGGCVQAILSWTLQRVRVLAG